MTASVVRLGSAGLAGRMRRAALGLVVQAGTRPFLNGRVPLSVRRRALGFLGRVASPMPRGATVDVVDLGGVRTWRVQPAGARADRGLFVLHGGGYNYGGLGTHGGAYATLAEAIGATLWMPDYRLVPENAPDACIEDAVRAWAALTGGEPDRRFAVTGDSAGGGLALAVACEARDAGLPAPSCLLLHSPWIDADPTTTAQRPEDRILHRSLMQFDADLWLGERDPMDPVLSPIRRDLHGLPPTMVQWGAHEALHQDAETLVAALEAAGVTVTAEAYPDLWHVAMLHVPALLEARSWLARAGQQAVTWMS